MKKLLFVYDNMSTGGTTTALLSLLDKIDYQQYEVDLLLFRNEGPFMDRIPKQVNLLEAAYRPILTDRIPMKYWKMLVFAVNGGLFGALKSYCLHKGTPKGIFRNILMHMGCGRKWRCRGMSRIRMQRRLVLLKAGLTTICCLTGCMLRRKLPGSTRIMQTAIFFRKWIKRSFPRRII